MSTLELKDESLQIAAVDCSDTELIVTLKDGRRIAAPLWWLPRLRDATPEQRANWDIMPFGDAVEWPEIDEHVSVKGLLRGKPASGAKPPQPPGSSQLPRLASGHLFGSAAACSTSGLPTTAGRICLSH
jgi:hypothetical protein